MSGDAKPELRPLVGVVGEPRIIASTAHRAEPTWVLQLACGHEVRRRRARSPTHARCDHCPKE